MTDETIDHKQFLAQLSDDQRVHFTDKSDLPGLLKLTSHIIAFAISSYWIYSGLPGWQVAMVFQGVMIVFLFTLLHETVHFTPFKTPWINQVVGWMSGFLILLPPLWFRYFHLAHHRFTHEPGKDPELDGPPIDSMRRYLWALTGLPVWWSHFKTLFKNASGNFEYAFLPAAAHGRVVREARCLLAIYSVFFVGSVALASQVLLWLWIIPAILGQPFLRLYLMAEHGRCPHVANMFENTRTTFTNMLVRWLAWNMPYHIEHHAYPAVPFHKLPDFHEVAKVYLQTTENGYASFHAKTVQHLQTPGNSI